MNRLMKNMDPSELNRVELKENLQRILKARQIRPSQLAKAVGIPVSTVSRWASAEGSVRDLNSLKKCCDYLGVSMEEVLFGVQPHRELELVLQILERGLSIGEYELILRRKRKD